MWEQRYRELVLYRERFGDCEVPRRWVENEALARWVEELRRRRWASVRTGIKDASTLTQTQVRAAESSVSHRPTWRRPGRPEQFPGPAAAQRSDGGEEVIP